MPVAAPECPRCGYDQSGVVASWNTSAPPACPLDGVCTECGLEFRWADLISERLLHETRFFEVAQWQLTRSFVRTMVTALRPRAFWRWVRMEHPISWVRLPSVPLAGMASVHVVMLLAALLCGALIMAFSQGQLGPTFLAFRQAPVPLVALLAWTLDEATRRSIGQIEHYPASTVHPLVAVALAASVVMPAAFLLLPTTLRRARVRRRHLVRICFYSLIPFPAFLVAPRLAFLLWDRFTWNGWRWGPDAATLWRLTLHVRWWIIPLLVLGWLYIWWTWALRSYLRLPHARANTILMLALSFVVATALCAVIGGGMWFVTAVGAV
ncbi:MAG: hypothetical protein WD749_12550 [Phycisphaerales bacterium]